MTSAVAGWFKKAETIARPRPAPMQAAAPAVLPPKTTELPMGVQLPKRSENPFRFDLLKHWVFEATYDAGYDGALVGGERVLLKADAERVDFRKLRGVLPARDPPSGQKVLFVNGIWTDVPWQTDFMKMIAEHTGHEMVGLHNSTNSLPVDMVQALTDKVGLPGLNSATPALATQLCQVLRDSKPGETLELMAFSQGALVTANAITQTRQKLHDHFLSQGGVDDKGAWALADQKIRQLKVTVFGGAAAKFPPGPQYEHYLNVEDIVPLTAGLGPAVELQLLTTGAKPPIVLNDVPGANGPVHVFAVKCIPKTDPRYYEAIRPAHALPLYLEQWSLTHGRPKSSWTAQQLDPSHRPRQDPDAPAVA